MEPTWNIETHIGIGPLEFGMSREEVRERVGTFVRTFRFVADIETDGFSQPVMHTHYDAQDRLIMVQCYGEVRVEFGDLDLLKAPMTPLLEKLKAMGFVLHPYDIGYHLPEAGFSLQAPPSGGEIVDSVIVYQEGYLDLL